MKTLFNSTFVVLILSLSYLWAAYYLETDRFNDTIVYKAPIEEIYVEPETEEVVSTSTPEVVIEEIAEEEPIPVIEEFVEIQPIVVETLPPPTEPITIDETENPTFSEINLVAREAMVNIFCLTQGPHQFIAPISGSGVVIDERGVILTNAHIAQLYLFEDFPKEDFVNCLIRTGSPAKATYKADLLYISPQWINANSEAIAAENPMGTGEDDYALLIITESANNTPLPETFSYLEPDTKEGSLERGDSLLIGGYPAGFLGGRSVQQDLYASTAITEAMELYTFDEEGFLDLVSLGGTVVAQQGASGGPTVSAEGKLVALISTSSEGDSTEERDLRAVTLEHIERSLIKNNKTTLKELLSGDLKVKAAAFKTTAAPTLLQILLSSF